nr:MAG TPA: hypothetical protein [Caudoviricetes sp.]
MQGGVTGLRRTCYGVLLLSIYLACNVFKRLSRFYKP